MARAGSSKIGQVHKGLQVVITDENLTFKKIMYICCKCPIHHKSKMFSFGDFTLSLRHFFAPCQFYVFFFYIRSAYVFIMVLADEVEVAI